MVLELIILLLDNQGLALRKISNEEVVPYGQIADFLMSRGDFFKAEQFAAESLKSSPTDFSNWHRIIKIKIALKQPEKALIILNNAPMSAYPENDFFKTLPKPVLISLPGTNAADSPADSSAALSILEKLKSQNLRGTFKGAYELLVEIYKELGWDGLLDCRSRVFVMEREYMSDSGDKGDDEKDKDVVSSHSAEEAVDNSQSSTQLKSPLNEPLSFPVLPSPQFLRSTGKNLCERWLDNLILILFEDLRIFSLYEEELRLKKESGKGVKEWLLLGKLSMRLQHTVNTVRFMKMILISLYYIHTHTFTIIRKKLSWRFRSVFLVPINLTHTISTKHTNPPSPV